MNAKKLANRNYSEASLTTRHIGSSPSKVRRRVKRLKNRAARRAVKKAALAEWRRN